MADIMSREKRSSLMSRIRGKDTGPELALRRGLWAAGLRGYRLRPNLPGKPDIAFMQKKVAVFVDGCFWHGCPNCYIAPSTNSEYWKRKLRENRLRDRKVDKALVEIGWNPIHFWEHDVRENPKKVVGAIQEELSKQNDVG